MNLLKDISDIYKTYFILIVILIFVVSYVIYNYKTIEIGNIYNGNYTVPILITCLILLLTSLFICDDNKRNDTVTVQSEIYKILNNGDINPNLSSDEIINNQSTNKGKFYKILNDNNMKQSKSQSQQIAIENHGGSKKERRNVFLPYNENNNNSKKPKFELKF